MYEDESRYDVSPSTMQVQVLWIPGGKANAKRKSSEKMFGQIWRLSTCQVKMHFRQAFDVQILFWLFQTAFSKHWQCQFGISSSSSLQRVLLALRCLRSTVRVVPSALQRLPGISSASPSSIVRSHLQPLCCRTGSAKCFRFTAFERDEDANVPGHDKPEKPAAKIPADNARSSH